MATHSPSLAPADDDDDDLGLGLLLEEPSDYRPSTPPNSTRSYTLTTAPYETLTLSIVGHNPLWGHMLWNAGLVISQYLEARAATLLSGNSVLELGAGVGLPSLVCALRGARRVVVTDYPDLPLVANIQANIDAAGVGRVASVAGYCWGANTDELLGADNKKFEVVLLSDLLFNHSEHAKLADTVVKCMARTPEARALVFFTPHRPWLYEKDLAFFKVVEEVGMKVEKILEKVLDAPMFEEDRGDRDLRRTVFGYELSWSEASLETK